MGDTKHIRLITVRSASQKEIQDAIHHEFVPGVHSHKYPKGADRNSVTVEVIGDVDAGKLYDRLKKIASSVEIEIEPVIPGGTSVTSAAVQALNNLIIERDREHEIKQLMETIAHLNSKISTLELKSTISEDGRRATKRELERVKQQLSQLKI